VLLAGILWLRREMGTREIQPESSIPMSIRWSAFGIVVFIWLNAILLRTIHYWAHVQYVPQVLWQATLVQASLSIFWTSLALATMVLATAKAHRLLWCVGAALMVIVVVKLLLVDLSKIGSIARIVSFIGVGLLMLIIGYFAPMPPQRKEQVQ
jgi:uncharacterized membrane protein